MTTFSQPVSTVNVYLVMFYTLFLTTSNFFVFFLHLFLVMVVKIYRTSIRNGHNFRAKNFNKKPWITSEILKQMQIRDFYLRKYLNCKSVESRNFYFSICKRYRNLVVGLCRQSKTKYLLDYFHQNAKKHPENLEGCKGNCFS